MRILGVVLFAVCSVAVVTGLEGPRSAFEAVSIKRDTSGSRAVLFGTVKGAAFSVQGATAASLIRYAYPAEDRSVRGLPSWASSERYVIVAKTDSPVSREEVSAMLRAMLEDRLKLTMHYERVQGRIYALVLADPKGPKAALRKIALDCNAIARANERAEPVPETANGAPPCGMRSSGGTMDSGGIDMAALAENLSPAAGRPVFDRTNLDGNFAFTLKYVSGAPRADASGDDPPTVFTALPEQLGLKLQPLDGELRTIVIDHLERPSEN